MKFRGRQELSERVGYRVFTSKLSSILVSFKHHTGQFALPAARGDRFLIRRRHGRRQNLHTQLRHGCQVALPGDVLAVGRRCGGLGRRFRQLPDLPLLRLHQAEVQFSNPQFQRAGRSHGL